MEQYVYCLFNKTLQIFCFTEELNSILCGKGINRTFHVECDVSSTSQRRVLSHETVVQFRPLAAYYIFHNIRFVSVHEKASKAPWKKN